MFGSVFPSCIFSPFLCSASCLPVTCARLPPAPAVIGARPSHHLVGSQSLTVFLLVLIFISNIRNMTKETFALLILC